MSDQTNPGEAGDFRGSTADKRKDETVMVNADDLSNLVSNARQEPAPVVPPAAPQPAPAAASSSRTLIIGVVGVIIILLLIAIVFIAR